MSDAEDPEIDLGRALGSESASSVQVLTLYIPEKNRVGKKIPKQRDWVRQAADLLAHIGGGVTIMPPVEGGWLDPEAGQIVWEKPVLLYTYVKPEEFLGRLTDLRDFLHRLGRETNQGEIALEFDGEFYRITDYDQPRQEES